jgi:hypothetical protein
MLQVGCTTSLVAAALPQDGQLCMGRHAQPRLPARKVTNGLSTALSLICTHQACWLAGWLLSRLAEPLSSYAMHSSMQA